MFISLHQNILFIVYLYVFFANWTWWILKYIVYSFWICIIYYTIHTELMRTFQKCTEYRILLTYTTCINYVILYYIVSSYCLLYLYLLLYYYFKILLFVCYFVYVMFIVFIFKLNVLVVTHLHIISFFPNNFFQGTVQKPGNIYYTNKL